MWIYSNINDVYRISFANVLGFLLFILFVLFFRWQYSRMLFILAFFFILIATVFYRVFIRDYVSKKQNIKINSHNDELNDSNSQKILLVGAGEAGRTILSEYARLGLLRNIVGFVDDDLDKIGKIFNGKRILDTTSKIGEVISKYNVNEVIISMPSASSEHINRIVLLIKKVFKKEKDIKIKILPSLLEILDKKFLIGSLREVNINDLIGREEVIVDTKAIERDFSDKVILVTGAGGSIGSEICRQLLKFNIKRLITVGRGECSIYNLIKTMNRSLLYVENKPEIIFKIANVLDSKLMNTIFEQYRPDVVFHAAAHKHVPLMEFNEVEAFQNNVIGTLNVLELSKNYNVEKFVLISTDKAVNPTSIMGATKRIAEFLALYCFKENGLKTSIVRFGNVIGSRGSVIPLFQEQIKSGGPITVTHPEVKRYFMTIPEASILVINAAAYALGGEIFILNMGKQYRILDIARNLIRFYGYEPDKDIKIDFTGLRPGEKLYEELSYDKEKLQKTDNDKIFFLDTKEEFYDKRVIEDLIKNSSDNFLQLDSLGIRNYMKEMVAEYNYESHFLQREDTSKLIS